MLEAVLAASVWVVFPCAIIMSRGCSTFSI